MPRPCAWCQSDLDQPGTSVSPEAAPVSHGVCTACLRRALAAPVEQRREALDRIAGPVFLLDEKARILVANRRASAALQWPEGEMDRLFIGDALDCRQSREAGCGDQADCAACTILRAIADTAATGRARRGVTADTDLVRPGGGTRMRCVITPEQAGEAVLLRLDEFAPVA